MSSGLRTEKHLTEHKESLNGEVTDQWEKPCGPIVLVLPHVELESNGRFSGVSTEMTTVELQ